MKIALAQINTTVGDFAGNARKVIDYSRRAAERGADWVVFPELTICGYPPRDLLEKPAFLERAEAEVGRLAKELPDITVLLGYVRPSGVREGKPAADAAALLKGGKVLLDYSKILLPTYDVFDEGRYFEPGQSCAVHETRHHNVAITICEDIWNDKNFWEKRLYIRDPVEEAVGKGANLLVNIAASPFAGEKIGLREEMLRKIATTHRLPVVYVNQVGGNDSLVFDGSSMALDAEGRVRARARSFAEDLVVFDSECAAEDVHSPPASEIEAIYQALVLGTRDYVTKCGFKKGIVGLSGGIDSSVVAAIAAEALGPGNVLGVSMPGPYSSTGSRRDAEALARNLGIKLHAVPITPLFEGYIEALDPVFGDLPRDVTEENIQARIRGNILMALSNKFGALLLSTGNKSELAAGYCTLYGDMAGGLTVISDVPKTMVYEMARYINRAKESIPRASIEKAPSAELRDGQTDQDSLPAYDVLDTIVRAYIEENLTAREITEKYRLEADLVQKTVHQLNRAEYKRQQAPPGLKVTTKAFGIGRRYPIAQKFFE